MSRSHENKQSHAGWAAALANFRLHAVTVLASCHQAWHHSPVHQYLHVHRKVLSIIIDGSRYVVSGSLIQTSWYSLWHRWRLKQWVSILCWVLICRRASSLASLAHLQINCEIKIGFVGDIWPHCIERHWGIPRINQLERCMFVVSCAVTQCIFYEGENAWGLCP